MSTKSPPSSCSCSDRCHHIAAIFYWLVKDGRIASTNSWNRERAFCVEVLQHFISPTKRVTTTQLQQNALVNQRHVVAHGGAFVVCPCPSLWRHILNAPLWCSCQSHDVSQLLGQIWHDSVFSSLQIARDDQFSHLDVWKCHGLGDFGLCAHLCLYAIRQTLQYLGSGSLFECVQFYLFFQSVLCLYGTDDLPHSMGSTLLLMSGALYLVPVYGIHRVVHRLQSIWIHDALDGQQVTRVQLCLSRTNGKSL